MGRNLIASAAHGRMRAFLVLWALVSGVYALSIVVRVLQHVSLGLATLAAVAAVGSVWMCLIDLLNNQPGTPSHGLRTQWSVLRIIALALCAAVAVLNGILMLQGFRNGEPFPLVRLLSTVCLFYGSLSLWRAGLQAPGAGHNPRSL
jgi:hypothetical protein